MFRQKGSILFVYSVMLFGLLLPLLFFITSSANGLNLNTTLVWVIMLVCSLNVSLPIMHNERSVMEMTFWLFTYVFMGIVPFVQLLANRFPWKGEYSDDTIATCLLMVLMGMAAYQMGTIVGKRKKTGPSSRVPASIDISVRSYFILSLAAIALALGLQAATAGFHTLFVPRNLVTSNLDTKSSTLIASQLIKVPIFVCLILGIVLWRLKRFDNAAIKGFTILLAVINLVVANPISTPRYWFGSVVLTIMMVSTGWGKSAYLRWVAGYIVLFIVVFPYADLFRNDLDTSVHPQQVSDVMILKPDYDAFQMLLNTTQYVDRYGTTHGMQLLGALFFFVPRTLWLNKPVGSGQFVGEAMHYGFTNLSSPLWAEAYINFGYLGIAVLFALYGYASVRIQAIYNEDRLKGSFTKFRMLVPFLSAYQFFLLRGDLMNGIAYVSSFLLFTYWFTYRTNRRDRTEPAYRQAGGGKRAIVNRPGSSQILDEA